MLNNDLKDTQHEKIVLAGKNKKKDLHLIWFYLILSE